MDIQRLQFDFRYDGYLKLRRNLKLYFKEFENEIFDIRHDLRTQGVEMPPAHRQAIVNLRHDLNAFYELYEKQIEEFEEIGLPNEYVRSRIKFFQGKFERLHERVAGILKPYKKMRLGLKKEHQTIEDSFNFVLKLPYLSEETEDFIEKTLEE